MSLERNLGEPVRLMEVRPAQFQFDSNIDKGVFQVSLAMAQRLAGDTAGVKVTAEQARKTLES